MWTHRVTLLGSVREGYSHRVSVHPVFVDAHSYACHLSVDVSLGQRDVYASALPVQSLLGTGVTREKVPFKVPCPCAQKALFHLWILHSILGTGPEDRDSILDSGAVWPEPSLQPSLGCLPS